jgi:hypothetical protein
MADLQLDMRNVDPSPDSTPILVSAESVVTVSFAQWKAIDKLELENGRKAGKIREKSTHVAEMLDAMAPEA